MCVCAPVHCTCTTHTHHIHIYYMYVHTHVCQYWYLVLQYYNYYESSTTCMYTIYSIVERRPLTSCPPQSFARRAAFATIPFQSIEVLDVLE